MKKRYATGTYMAWMVVLLAWFIVTETGWVVSSLIPAPLAVIRAFGSLVKNGYNGNSLLYHLAISGYRLIIASVGAVLLGVPLGLLSGFSSKIREVLDSFIQFYRPLPPLAYYTLLILWFGIGESSKILLLFLAAFAPIYIASVNAVGQVDENYIRNAKSLGASRKQIFQTIIIPATLPHIMTGIQTAVGVAYTTLISSEMVASTSGIGWMVIDASRYLKSDVMFVGIIMMGVTGIALNSLLKKLERRLIYWQYLDEQKTSSKLLTVILAVIVLLSLVFGLSQGVSWGNQTVIRIGTIRVPNDKQVAISLGYFEEAFSDIDVDLEYIFFDSGVAANQALLSGSVEFVEMGYTNGIVALASDIPAELIWVHDILGENEALVVQEHSDYKTLEDLAGSKIATPFSSTSHYSLLNVLNMVGLADQVTLLDMETKDIVAAWQRGDIDGAYTWEPTLTELKATGRTLIDSQELNTAGFGTYNIGLVHKEFAETHPEYVVCYIQALDRAVKSYRQNEENVVSAVAQSLELSEAEVKDQMAMSQWVSKEEQLAEALLGTEPENGAMVKTFERTIAFLYDNQSITVKPSETAIRDFINTSYIETIETNER